jgi:4-amino-4-deoxy-L-arabinose transferase-like glycosyltransferase
MTAVLGLLAVVIGRGVGPAHAFWTVFIFATSVLVVWSAKACTTDAVLLAGITVAQVCLYALWRGNWSWPVVIAMAVAVAQAGLTKGPVVLGVMGMTLVVLGVFRLLDLRKARRGEPATPSPGTPGEGGGEGVRRTSGATAGADGNPPSPTPPHPNPLPEYGERGRGTGAIVARVVVALFIVAALVGPWLYLVQQREAAFLGTSVSHDVLKRIAQPLEGHRGPPGYHLALSFATFLPWSPLLPMAVVFGFKHRADPRVRFALAAVLGPWVMFELVRTKLPHYMLPAFPPLAFLAADAVVRWTRGEARRAPPAGVRHRDGCCRGSDRHDRRRHRRARKTLR